MSFYLLSRHSQIAACHSDQEKRGK